MKRSKRIEALDARPVNLDGYINEWPEMGFIAMKSPYDPTPSVRVEDGKIVELDGKSREDFDFIDQFIADYAINIDRAEKSMSVSSLEIARMIVDIHVSRKEILELISGEDGRSHEPLKCCGTHDGHAENPRKKSSRQSGAYHKSERRPGTDRRRCRRRCTERFF